jgi:AraC family transcriptional regulator of adaptative response/methylated-DNA-[protein]-cysteine methyltransferase
MDTQARTRELPAAEILYKALIERDSQFDGVCVVGVVTTGIFCRLTCGARKPKRENVEFFASAADALHHGYRPCKLCTPLEVPGEAPDWLRPFLDDVHAAPERRWKDQDLRDRGLEPDRVRRWFQKHHGVTFHAYGRALRLATAVGRSQAGAGYESLSGFAEAFAKTTGNAPTRSQTLRLVTVTRILTPLGPMIAGATAEGVCLLEFADRRMLETQLGRIQKALHARALPGTSPHVALLERQLAEYFAGTRRTFTVPLVTAGTPFQERVWQALQEIPCGETRSYQDQANAIGRPTAVRAVARANGDNRISILIPCHRVIGKDGKLVGYGGGLWRKHRLLEIEGHSS